MTKAEIQQLIDDDLASNGKRDIKASHLRGVLSELLNYIDATQLIKLNLTVLNVIDGQLVSHGLGSDRLEVKFFVGNKENREITWEPVGQNDIRVYLPELDGVGVNSFSGDVFIIKRV
jgi:hypothetical protein